MSGSESKITSISAEPQSGATANASALKGRQILLVKGDLFAADEVLAAFQDCGATIVGPVGDVIAALDLIGKTERLDGAVLDMDFEHETVLPLVQEMTRRRVPFVFSTASYEADGEMNGKAAAQEPFDIEQVLTTLATRIAQRQGAHVPYDGQVTSPNKLLQMMAPQHLAALAPHVRRVELKTREILVEENHVIPAVWFPETAVISLLVAAEGARAIEVGMIGPEGMTDLVVNQGDRSALRTCVLTPGTALVVESRPFVAAMTSPGFDRFVLAFKEAISIQFAYAALSHGTSTIDARLARWILMLDDRLEGGSIPVVHNHIADLLAVRRSGVTTALHVLEGMGAIKSVRGMIMVRDRSVLKQLAGATYGMPEAEYERLMSRVSHRGP